MPGSSFGTFDVVSSLISHHRRLLGECHFTCGCEKQKENFCRRIPLHSLADHSVGSHALCSVCTLARNTTKYLRMTQDNGTVLVMDFFPLPPRSQRIFSQSSFAFPFGDYVQQLLLNHQKIKVRFGRKERDWNYVTEAWRISVTFVFFKLRSILSQSSCEKNANQRERRRKPKSHRPKVNDGFSHPLFFCSCSFDSRSVAAV